MKLFGLIKLIKWLQGATTKEIVMAKADVVAAGIAALAQAESDAFGVAYDSSFAEGVASVPPSTGGIPQSVVDGLNQQIADLTAKDAADVKAGTDALAALQVKLDDASKQLTDALAAKQADEQVISGLQASVAGIRALADQLAAIVLPPVPAPVPPPAA